jgi:hypothetical protein
MVVQGLNAQDWMMHMQAMIAADEMICFFMLSTLGLDAFE